MHKINPHILFNRPSNTQQLVNMETREWQCSKCWRTIQAVVNCSIFCLLSSPRSCRYSYHGFSFCFASEFLTCFACCCLLQPPSSLQNYLFLGWRAFFTGRKKLHLMSIFTVLCYKQSAVLLRQFVRPSVRLCVTLRYRGHRLEYLENNFVAD